MRTYVFLPAGATISANQIFMKFIIYKLGGVLVNMKPLLLSLNHMVFVANIKCYSKYNCYVPTLASYRKYTEQKALAEINIG